MLPNKSLQRKDRVPCSVSEYATGLNIAVLSRELAGAGANIMRGVAAAGVLALYDK